MSLKNECTDIEKKDFEFSVSLSIQKLPSDFKI